MASDFFAKKWITWLLVILFLGFNFLLTYTLPVNLVLDLKFLYSHSDMVDNLNQMGAQGRMDYFKGILFLDMPYLVVYGFLFCKILKNLWSGTQLYFLTIAIAAADFSENVLMLYHIRSFPTISSQLAILTSGITSLKWGLVFFMFTLIIVGLLRKLFFIPEKKEKVH